MHQGELGNGALGSTILDGDKDDLVDLVHDGNVPLSLRARRQGKNRKSSSFFVSSPAAFSSDTRDASIHQGKFDMCSVLQTQLLRGSPCLVCDISGGQVMVKNNECEELFESSEAERQLVQSDIYALIHDEDHDKLST